MAMGTDYKKREGCAWQFFLGGAGETDSAFLSTVELFELMSVSRTIAETYAQIARDLRANWRLIGLVVLGSSLLFC
jgi:hypothetical protein